MMPHMPMRIVFVRESHNLPSNRPKQVQPDVLTDLGELVCPNRYVRIDHRKDFPESLRAYAPDRFKTAIIASSNFTCSSTYPGAEYAPNGPVYLLRIYRYCEHDGSPHFNVDDTALWTDRRGQQWRASSKDSPDHYQAAVAGTLVSDVWSQYHFPVASSGPLEDFRREGAYLNFVQACPGLAAKSPDEQPL